MPGKRHGWAPQAWMCCLGFAAICVAARGQPDAVFHSIEAEAGEVERLQALARVSEVLLGVRAARVAPVVLPADAAQGMRIELPLGEDVVELELAPGSVRAPGYRVLAQVAGGNLVEVPPSPAKTLQGEIVGLPGSRAGLAISDAGLSGAIALPGGGMYWIEPIGHRLAGAGALPADHVIYHGDDVIGQAGTCEISGEPIAAFAAAPPANAHEHEHEHAEGGAAAAEGGVAGAILCTAELACDADFEFYQAYGSVPAVEARINAIINAVNVQYSTEVGIEHEITQIIVRTAEPDPYTASGASALLAEFRTEWNANHAAVQRDLAHLFTGRNLDGTTIGTAYLSAVCSSAGYGLSQSDCCGSFACATDLTSHELGHNWGANHCTCNGVDPADDYTMNPSLLCANQFHPIHTIPEIIDERDSLNCLSCASTLVSAPVDAFTIKKGLHLGGDLAQLLASDDGYLRLRCVNNGSGSQKLTDTHVHVTSPHLNVTQLNLRIETRGDEPGIKARVFLRNWDTNSWHLLHEYNLPQNDAVRYYPDIPNPNRFVDDTTGEVRVRLYTKRSTSAYSGAYKFRIDRVQVTVSD